MKSTHFFLAILLLACHAGSNRTNENTSSGISKPAAIEDSVAYNDVGRQHVGKIALNDSSGVPPTLKALKDFHENGTNRSSMVNDSLFVTLLRDFTTYQNLCNERLLLHPEGEKLNTLAYSEDGSIAPEAIEFRDSVGQLGFMISQSEGMIFLEKDPGFLNRFHPYLSDRMNVFLQEYCAEILEPLADDGGLVLSNEEHVRRMIFWETFANRHPDFELVEYAKEQSELYLFSLMFGMDNTPVYDWESKKFHRELVELYRSVIHKFPESTAAVFLEDYLAYISRKNFIFDDSFDEYARRKFPGRFGA